MTAPSDHRVSLADQIDAWLPQTQCTRCGYPRCRAYAEALADGRADINQCPPGGEVTLKALCDLLDVPTKPLNPKFGPPPPRTRAVIDETRCIGCRKCLEACPVDAILGARHLMHTVIAHECTGCELCLPPCPVDCIQLVPVAPDSIQDPWPEYTRLETDHWRRRTENRLRRLARGRRRRSAADTPRPIPDRDAIRAEIRAAVARVRARKRGSSGSNSPPA